MSMCIRMQMWRQASCYMSAYTRKNHFLICRRPSPVCLDFCDVSCSHLASAWLLQRNCFSIVELRKERASLAWVEMPFSAFLYLSIAPAPSLDEIRKVGQWRAKEGWSTGRLEAGREADEGVEERWEGGGLCTEDISPCLEPGSRHSLSWFDFLLCCSTYSAHCNGCWVWTWTWQLQVKGISHLKKGRCLFSSAGLLAYLSKWTSKATGK